MGPGWGYRYEGRGQNAEIEPTARWQGVLNLVVKLLKRLYTPC